jgi:hypothetical protein
MYTPCDFTPAIDPTSTWQTVLGGIQGRIYLIPSSGRGVCSGRAGPFENSDGK